MSDIEALAIHQVRGRVERLDFVVEPFALGAIAVGLALQRQIGRQFQLKATAQPDFLPYVAVIEDVIVGVEGAVVDGDGAEIGSVVVRDVIAGDDAARRMRSAEGDRHQRRAPIGLSTILAVFDRAPDLETVGDAVVELTRHIQHFGAGVVDKAVKRGTADVEAVVEALHVRAAARAVMRAERVERIPGEIGLVPDRPRVRLLGDEVDCAAGRALARDQRGRTFQEFHGFQIGGVGDPRGHVLRADLDAIVERVDLAVGEAAHREARRLPRSVAGGDADRALRRLGHGAIALLAHGLGRDHLDGRGRLPHRQAEPRGAFGDCVGVERGCRLRLHRCSRHRRS